MLGLAYIFFFNNPDNPLNLTIQYNTSEDHKKLAIAVQQFWKAIGVNVTLNNYEWKVHIDRLNNQDFEIARQCDPGTKRHRAVDAFAFQPLTSMSALEIALTVVSSDGAM